MSIAGKTDTGKKRSMNEDSFHAEQINNIHLAVVCDGVGGAKAGEVASAIGVNSFVETFKKLLDSKGLQNPSDIDSNNYYNNDDNKNDKNERNDFKYILVSSVAKANEDIFTASKEKDKRGMGTTMVACVFDKDADEYYAVNVGDSRLYIIDEKKQELTQITKDHSLVQDMVDIGVLTKEQAEKSPKKNIITRVLGMDYEIDVDFYNDKYESGTFLLCSDGLNDYVSEDDIIKFVSLWMRNGGNDGNDGNGNGNESGNTENIEGCLTSLISKANENGGGDNITAVIIKP